MMREGYSWPILILGIVRSNNLLLDWALSISSYRSTMSSLSGFSYCLQVSIL